MSSMRQCLHTWKVILTHKISKEWSPKQDLHDDNTSSHVNMDRENRTRPLS